MSVIGTLKKIFSNYNGQTPSTGKEVEDAFNENFYNVENAINNLVEDVKNNTETIQELSENTSGSSTRISESSGIKYTNYKGVLIEL